jgi:hypothetical protein
MHFTPCCIKIKEKLMMLEHAVPATVHMLLHALKRFDKNWIFVM